MIIRLNTGSRASILILACLVLASVACAHREKDVESNAPLEGIGTIAVIGFQPAALPHQQPGMVQNPLTRALRYAEPAPQEAADQLTNSLFSRLARASGVDFIPPQAARSLVSAAETPFKAAGDLEIYSRIAESLSADAFLAGYIWRWNDRKGAEFAVESPASVEFDLCLVRMHDKAVVWKYLYNKTQQSLAENFLDVKTFVKAKGRWLSASELAELGLEETVEAFPKRGE